MSLNPFKTPEPVFKIIATRPLGYEIRSYSPMLIAEVDNPNGDNSTAFRTLAAYIGVFQTPANVQTGTGQAEGISMTAPVVMPQTPGVSSQSEPIAMTAPVMQQSGHTMQFIMPDKYTHMSQLPQPTDTRVRLREVGGRCVGVLRYSGNATNVLTLEKVGGLVDMLVKDRLLLETDKNTASWSFCGYDPPFTPGPFRRNEVWVDLKMSEEKITKKLAELP